MVQELHSKMLLLKSVLGFQLDGYVLIHKQLLGLNRESRLCLVNL